MQVKVSILCAILGSVVVSCGDANAPPEPASQTHALSPSCPTNVAIYERPGAICPAGPAGWVATDLFPGTAVPKLKRFCRYTWTGGGAPDFTLLTQWLQLATNSSNTADEDCPVVAPLGFADSPAVHGPLMETFKQQAGHPGSLPPGKEKIRVAVIDGAVHAFSSSSTDTWGHGRTVGRVIDELSCPPGGACASQIENYLALPQITPYNASFTNGGYFGLRGQLAEAIYTAVQKWADEYSKYPKNVPPRLILNLSVGWTPEHGGHDLKKMPSPARAVYEALEHAACYGALTLAASGNHSGGGSSGPMLPGGWETVRAPGECGGAPYDDFKSPYPLYPDGGWYAPLVHAVSAVDALDRPVSTTRPDGQSRLVAYGTNVMTSDTRNPTTLILSGTSMSTAIASAAATVAWSQMPDLTNAEVMDLVYGSAVKLIPGDPTGHRQTDFCVDMSSCWAFPLKRVSVCEAARYAHWYAGGSTPPKCKTVWEHAGSPPALPHDLTTIFPMPTTGSGSCPPSGCGTAGDTHLLTPWVDPQPSLGCDACFGSMVGWIYVDLHNPGYENIREITFLTYDARFTLIGAHRIQPWLADGGYPEVFRVEVPIPTGTRSAELQFLVDDGVRPYAMREPIQLY